MNIAEFKSDSNKEQSGVWVPLSADTKILVARIGNARMRKRSEELRRPHLALIRARALPESTQEELTYTAMAECVLLGWEGFTETIDGEEKPLAYSVETAKRLLRDLPEFRDRVIDLSSNFELFKDEGNTLAIKNS